ncbi:MAG: hypothetical protein HC836_37990 [Richelia sp. RM2_1_2]|nr:hypothetical protein [Richelia sp. RM2_1_2]
MSEKEILTCVARLGNEYRDVLTLACSNSLMVETIKLPIINSFFQEYNNSVEAITKMKSLLTDKRIIIPNELKALFQQELDVYHPTDNQTPLISALLMCVLQVEEFFKQIYLDVFRQHYRRYY